METVTGHESEAMASSQAHRRQSHSCIKAKLFLALRGHFIKHMVTGVKYYKKMRIDCICCHGKNWEQAGFMAGGTLDSVSPLDKT